MLRLPASKIELSHRDIAWHKGRSEKRVANQKAQARTGYEKDAGSTEVDATPRYPLVLGESSDRHFSHGRISWSSDASWADALSYVADQSGSSACHSARLDEDSENSQSPSSWSPRSRLGNSKAARNSFTPNRGTNSATIMALRGSQRQDGDSEEHGGIAMPPRHELEDRESHASSDDVSLEVRTSSHLRTMDGPTEHTDDHLKVVPSSAHPAGLIGSHTGTSSLLISPRVQSIDRLRAPASLPRSPLHISHALASSSPERPTEQHLQSSEDESHFPLSFLSRLSRRQQTRGAPWKSSSQSGQTLERGPDSRDHLVQQFQSDGSDEAVSESLSPLSTTQTHSVTRKALSRTAMTLSANPSSFGDDSDLSNDITMIDGKSESRPTMNSRPANTDWQQRLEELIERLESQSIASDIDTATIDRRLGLTRNTSELSVGSPSLPLLSRDRVILSPASHPRSSPLPGQNDTPSTNASRHSQSSSDVAPSRANTHEQSPRRRSASPHSPTPSSTAHFEPQQTPHTPGRQMRVYDDSLPSTLQPQTPLGLPRRGIPQMSMQGAFTAPSPPRHNHNAHALSRLPQPWARASNDFFLGHNSFSPSRPHGRTDQENVADDAAEVDNRRPRGSLRSGNTNGVLDDTPPRQSGRDR